MKFPSTFSRRCAGACIVLCLVTSERSCADTDAVTRDGPNRPLATSHPLVPGLVCDDLCQTDWPRTLHDSLASGFSPLPCGMSGPPRVSARISLGGRASSVHAVTASDGTQRLLVHDGTWSCLDLNGQYLWRSTESGELCYSGTLHGRSNAADAAEAPQDAIVLAAGARLTLLHADTGVRCWSHTFAPAHAHVRVRVADILPDHPGLEAAVVLAHAEEAAMVQFPPNGQPPQLLWQSSIVVPGEHPERHDHGCDLELDLSQVDQPIIWNIRRFRCIGVDARNGKVRSALSYDVGGAHRRNYGPWAIGRSADDTEIAVVVGERVQVHVHGIELQRDQPSRLAWEHYYGEVYKESPGVALENLAIGDLDGDGECEVLYSVRDPALRFRSVVRMRNGSSGAVEWELLDHWGVAAVYSEKNFPFAAVVTCPDPDRVMTRIGDLHIHVWRPGESIAGRPSAPTRIHVAHNSKLALAQSLPSGDARLLLQAKSESTPALMQQYSLHDGKLSIERDTRAVPLAHAEIEACLTRPTVQPVSSFSASKPQASATDLLVVREPSGALAGYGWEGSQQWSHSMQGGPAPTLAASDWDGDGRAEVMAITPNGTVAVVRLTSEGTPELVGEYPHLARWNSHSPLVYDVERTGRPCLIVPTATDDGRLQVEAIRHDGQRAWKSTPFAVAVMGVDSFVPHAGRFLPDGRVGVAVSVRDDRNTFEGMAMLDGATGQRLWFRDLHRRDQTVMPYRAQGIPTAVDVDGDGMDEIGIDMLSYMAFLNGEDGSFAQLNHTANISMQDATYAGHLYNTYVPVLLDAGGTARHWLAKGGFGPFGLMRPDIISGIWKVDCDYDVPANIGLIDVDGDGRLEVGYAAIHSKAFVCRDVASGEVEWTVMLPHAPNAPCLSADTDGDGRGEFLIGRYCLGIDDAKTGVILWQAPTPFGWAAIADLDGDGLGEIVCPEQNGIAVLRP